MRLLACDDDDDDDDDDVDCDAVARDMSWQILVSSDVSWRHLTILLIIIDFKVFDFGVTNLPPNLPPRRWTPA